jgi:hypothetical protein
LFDANNRKNKSCQRRKPEETIVSPIKESSKRTSLGLDAKDTSNISE